MPRYLVAKPGTGPKDHLSTSDLRQLATLKNFTGSVFSARSRFVQISGSGSLLPVGTTQSRYSPPVRGQKPMLNSSPSSTSPNSVCTRNLRRVTQSLRCSGVSSDRRSRAARASGDSLLRGFLRLLGGSGQGSKFGNAVTVRPASAPQVKRIRVRPSSSVWMTSKSDN